MVQGTGLHVLVERAISLNRPLRTRTVGGVGAGGEKPLATRLGFADLLLGLDNRRTAFEFNDTFCHSTALASEAK